MQMTSHRYSPEQIEQANHVNLLEYAGGMGLELKRASRQAWKVVDQGGMYIHADGTRWNCFSRECGGGPIQFVMHMKNKTWLEAMEELVGQPSDYDLRDVSKSDAKNSGTANPVALHRIENAMGGADNKPGHPVQPTSGRITEDKSEREVLVLPPKADTCKHVLAYLIQHRKLDRDVVLEMVKQGLLYENGYHSCVFVGKDAQGMPRFASVRSTNTRLESYRADVLNSDKAYSFNVRGTNDHLRVFESPIDLMSYLTLMKRNGITPDADHMLSLGGVSGRALMRYLKDYPDIRSVTLCLDNDEAGRTAATELTNRLRGKLEVRTHVPTCKDWNEELVAQVELDHPAHTMCESEEVYAR